MMNSNEPSLLTSNRSQAQIERLQDLINWSNLFSPLRQISGILTDQPKRQQKRVSNSTILSRSGHYQPVNKKRSFQSLIEGQLVEQVPNLRHVVQIECFKDLILKTDYTLIQEESSFCCCSKANSRLRCNYRFRDQSTFQLFNPGKDQQNLIYSINFDTIQAKIELQNKVKFSIVISTQRHQLQISAEDFDGLYIFKKMEDIKHTCLGMKYNLRKLNQVPEYFKQRYVTQKYFVENCSTGDIILFQDNHFMAKLQRFITSSNFNHVGMIIKDSNYGILIFESNTNNGVCLTQWKSLITYRWYEFIPKIAWRKLENVGKDQIFQEKIKQFLMKNLSKSFNISSRVLTNNTSVVVSSADEQNGQNSSEGFFCSELIATLYKDLGLITRETSNPNYQPACKFYPKDFSELSGRKLDNGHLSPEYQIRFDLELLAVNYPQYFSSS